MEFNTVNKISSMVSKHGMLIKISGGALSSLKDAPYDEEKLLHIVEEICKAYRALENPRIAIVVGGGNIWRGNFGVKFGIYGASADEVGIYATIINAMLLSKLIGKELGEDKVKLMLTRTDEPSEAYSREEALKNLAKNKIVIFGGGVDIPFCSTDFVAVNRAASLELGAVLMAKNGTNGIYDRLPTEKGAKRFQKISYDDFVTKQLQVADNIAIVLAKNKNVPLFFFNFEAKDALENIINKKEVVGTFVGNVDTCYDD